MSEDALHTFWTCPANCNLEDEAVTSTQPLINAAIEISPDLPCLWLRGLLPSHLTDVPSEYDPIDKLVIKFTNCDNNTVWGSGTYYGDSSGGEFASFSKIRRCDCELASVDTSGTLLFGASFNLPGDIQTVPRGEVFALVQLLELCEPLTFLDYVTDNRGLFDNYCKGPAHSYNSSNCDLYHRIYTLVYEKAIYLEVRWMPSHLLQNPTKGVFAGVSLTDIHGNNEADSFAEDVAKVHCVPLNVSAPVIYYASLT